MKALHILGTRGVPAAHGGFETFAEHLSLYLVQRGWKVTVYCQEQGRGPLYEDEWQGVRRVCIPVAGDGPASTMLFDWKSILHAARAGALCLTLGYNTALFCAVLRLARVPNIINMDGIEWRRGKWSLPARAWFWLNDWGGCWIGNHLVADHPEIARHLETRVAARKITTIAYGADRLPNTALSEGDAATVVHGLGLEPGNYLTLVARPEPENSILEVVAGFSRQPRGMRLAVLGRYDPAHAYHRAVQAAAGPEVQFLGAIYDKPVVQALRLHAAAYVHGHQVGGTNPSLVEALGAGNAVLAHDNRFNRWVLGDGGRYFAGADGFAEEVEALVADPALRERMRLASRARFDSAFTWDAILAAYEALLEQWALKARA